MKSKPKTNPKREQEKILVQLRIDQIKSEKSTEWMGQQIQELIKKGTLKPEDLALIAPYISIGDLIVLKTFVTRNSQGMYYSEAIELARRYHFLLCSLAGDNKTHIERSFRMYEAMVDKIYKGQEPEANLKFLRTLPSWTEWNEKVAHKLYKKSPYYPIKF